MSYLPFSPSPVSPPALLVRFRLVLLGGGGGAVELGGREAHGERLRRVGEGERAAARELQLVDERVLRGAEGADAAALVEDDEEEHVAVLGAYLPDEGAHAAVRAPERAGLADDAAATGAVHVALVERARIDACDRHDVRRLQFVILQLGQQR